MCREVGDASLERLNVFKSRGDLVRCPLLTIPPHRDAFVSVIEAADPAVAVQFERCS